MARSAARSARVIGDGGGTRSCELVMQRVVGAAEALKMEWNQRPEYETKELYKNEYWS